MLTASKTPKSPITTSRKLRPRAEPFYTKITGKDGRTKFLSPQKIANKKQRTINKEPECLEKSEEIKQLNEDKEYTVIDGDIEIFSSPRDQLEIDIDNYFEKYGRLLENNSILTDDNIPDLEDEELTPDKPLEVDYTKMPKLSTESDEDNVNYNPNYNNYSEVNCNSDTDTEEELPPLTESFELETIPIDTLVESIPIDNIITEIIVGDDEHEYNENGDKIVDIPITIPAVVEIPAVIIHNSADIIKIIEDNNINSETTFITQMNLFLNNSPENIISEGITMIINKLINITNIRYAELFSIIIRQNIWESEEIKTREFFSAGKIIIMNPEFTFLKKLQLLLDNIVIDKIVIRVNFEWVIGNDVKNQLITNIFKLLINHNKNIKLTGDRNYSSIQKLQIDGDIGIGTIGSIPNISENIQLLTKLKLTKLAINNNTKLLHNPNFIIWLENLLILQSRLRILDLKNNEITVMRYHYSIIDVIRNKHLKVDVNFTKNPISKYIVQKMNKRIKKEIYPQKVIVDFPRIRRSQYRSSDASYVQHSYIEKRVLTGKKNNNSVNVPSSPTSIFIPISFI